MQLLYWFESIRTPVLDTVMSLVTRLGEEALFLLAALGGSVGALLGMRVWRHKTLHRSFRIGIPLILAVQILIPAGLWLYWNVVR